MRSFSPCATAYSWLPLMASVLVAVMAPGATWVICRVAPFAPPTLTTPITLLLPAKAAGVPSAPP